MPNTQLIWDDLSASITNLNYLSLRAAPTGVIFALLLLPEILVGLPHLQLYCPDRRRCWLNAGS